VSASARITQIVPSASGIGFDAEVEIDGNIGIHTLTIYTSTTDIKDVPEEIRQKLYRLGVDMATAFQYANIVKTTQKTP
jgi:hypothetical protein